MDVPLPDELRVLFRSGDGADRVLPGPLLAGRIVLARDDEGQPPVCWLSDAPPAAGDWGGLRAGHGRSGLWPLLLESADDWIDWETRPGDMSSPAEHDAAELLRRWWAAYTAPGDGDPLSPAERLAVTAPYGQRWPGLAPTPTPAPALEVDADRTAARHADRLLAGRPEPRLALVAADRGSTALTALGWSGPANHTNDTAEVSAVVRAWEDRFGARVVGVGPDTLHLTVAAPPATEDQALHVAAEHFALCPDNIWQGLKPTTLPAYARRLTARTTWSFWWD